MRAFISSAVLLSAWMTFDLPRDTALAQSRPVTERPTSGATRNPPRRTPPPRPAADASVAASPRRTLDRDRFSESVNAAMQSKVMGYSFVLIGRGQLVAEGAGGLARNDADGRMAMTTRTPQNLGSLFKFVTGTTLLHMMDAKTPGSAAGSNSLDQLLGAEIAFLFPQIWQSAIGNQGIRKIEFRQLMQHRSGLRDCGSVMSCLQNGFQQANFDKRDYQNINFTLMGYLLPLFEQPSIINPLNGMLAAMKSGDKDKRLRDDLGGRMDMVIRNRTFAKAPGNITASCDAANVYKTTGAYGYRSRTDASNGIITSRIAAGEHCVGAGGYWMSVRDFAAYVATVMSSDRLLSPQAKRLMYSEQIEPDDRLIWTSASENQWIADNFAMPRVAWSNGIQPYDGGQGFRTVLLRLPLDHYFMLFVNSPDISTNQMFSIGVSAFKDATEQNF